MHEHKFLYFTILNLDVPINNQRLIFGGCKLEDDVTISEYNTHNEATLDLTGRLLSCVKCPDSSNHHYKH